MPTAPIHIRNIFIGFLQCFTLITLGYFCVHLSGRNADMAKKISNVNQIHTCFQQMDGFGMSKSMWMN